MPFYFSRFPKIAYKLPEQNKAHVVTDITRRFTIANLAKSKALVFYAYSVQEGDRPDIIADKYYKDSTLDWLVLIANEIHDPYWSWYMNTTQFDMYIRKKYGSVSAAQALNHHYEWIVSPLSQYTDDDGATIRIPRKTLIVDKTTYDGLDVLSRRAVDQYTYESGLNEKHRDIVLVDRKYVPFLIDQYKDLFV